LRRARTPPRGFTLVELLIVLGVIALATTLAVPAVRSVSGANARRSAGELAGSMRALFDVAALRHATCRMALDLDGRAWWAECASGRTDRAPRAPSRCGAPGREGRGDAAALARPSSARSEDRVVKKRERRGARFGPVRVEDGAARSRRGRPTSTSSRADRRSARTCRSSTARTATRSCSSRSRAARASSRGTWR
jgi:general secretion pathway protein H